MIFSISVIISSYYDHCIIIWWSSYHHKAKKTLHMPYFGKGWESRLSSWSMILWSVILVISSSICENEGTQGYKIWYSCVSFLSYDDHHIIIWRSSSNREDPTHAIFSKRRGLNDIKYDVPVCHSCCKMIIKQANLLHLSIWVSHNFTLSSFCLNFVFLN